MRVRICIFGGVVGYLVGSLVTATLQAQTQVPVANAGDKLCWDQPGQSLTEVQSNVYTVQWDVSKDVAIANAKTMSAAKKAGKPATMATGTWVNVSCQGTNDPATPNLFNCLTVIPTELTQGQHTVWVTTENAASVSATSDPFVFVYSATANMKPINLRITKSQ